MNKVIICGKPEFNKTLKEEIWHRFDVKATTYDSTSHEAYPDFEVIMRQIKNADIVIIQTQTVNADISLFLGLAKGFDKFIIGIDGGEYYPNCYFTYDICELLYDDEEELLADLEEYL